MSFPSALRRAPQLGGAAILAALLVIGCGTRANPAFRGEAGAERPNGGDGGGDQLGAPDGDAVAADSSETPGERPADVAEAPDGPREGSGPEGVDAPDAMVDGAGDAGPDGADGPADAVEAPPACAVASMACYTGSGATRGVGACRDGISYCVGGVFGPCIGQVLPSPESCNNVDDDCDGSPASGAPEAGLGTISCGVGACANTAAACQSGLPGTCTPKAASTEVCGNGLDDDCNGLTDDPGLCSCIYVLGSGDDGNPGTPASPKRTIAGGIAGAVGSMSTKQVCVGSAPLCGTTPATTDYPEMVDMVDGISVYGGFEPDTSGGLWKRATTCVTRIVAPMSSGNDRAVHFGVTVVTNTVLDGFTVQGNDQPTNQAVLVEGSVGAALSNDVILGGGGATSYGVNVIADPASSTAATPLLARCTVAGGTGTALAIAVRVKGSAAHIQQSCDTTDSGGRCTSGACGGGVRYLRGRTSGNGAAGSESYAVRLDSAVGSVIEQSSLCAQGQGNVAAVRLSGDATGVVVRTSNLAAGGPVTSGAGIANLNGVGLWADPCAAASPWIFNNYRISGQSRSPGGRGDGVRAIGDCHPRVDANLTIVGGDESANNDAIGVYCARDASSGLASQCTVLANGAILGSGSGFPPTATGVKCDAGACARIQGNKRISANNATTGYGVVLNGAGTFVDNNVIDAGCTKGTGTGLLVINAPSRVQNNLVYGAVACTGAAPPVSEAVRVQIGSGPGELDLHSNDLFGLGVGGLVSATSRALVFEVGSGGAAPGPSGVIRNNILHGGISASAFDVLETSSAADPRIFENNDFWYASPSATVLYRDEGATNLTTLGAVNGVVDPTGLSNISADPHWVAPGAVPPDLHLQSGSPCRNTGTAAGAPTTDYGGQTRPGEDAWDIGAEEFFP